MTTLDEVLKEVEELDKNATKGPMYAVADEGDTAPEDEAVWTISPNPNEEGWRTDCGYPGYGLNRNDAEFYARARTLLPQLANVCKLLYRWSLANCQDIDDEEYLNTEINQILNASEEV